MDSYGEPRIRQVFVENRFSTPKVCWKRPATRRERDVRGKHGEAGVAGRVRSGGVFEEVSDRRLDRVCGFPPEHGLCTRRVHGEVLDERLVVAPRIIN